MRVAFLGNGLSLASGHSRLAWQMARHLLECGSSARIVGSESGGAGMRPQHKALIAEEEYESLWRERIEFPRGTLRANNRELRKRLEPELAKADIVHVFDMRALRALHKMFEGEIPGKTVLQFSSLANLRFRYIVDAGPGALLQTVTNPTHVVAAILPARCVSRLFRPADAVVCTSQFLATTVRELYDVAESRLSVVPTGVEIPSGEDNKIQRRPDFIYFGWPGAHRGTLDAARAFARFLRQFPDADCLICAFAHSRFLGEDVLILKALKHRYAARGVRHAGFFPDIRRRLRGVRAAVLPFRSPFGYAQPPLVVLEAMAAGVPVISTDVGSVGEVVRHGDNGFLVQRGDVPAMLECMRRLWLDDDLYAKMSRAAKATVREHYSLEEQLARTRETYERLVENQTN